MKSLESSVVCVAFEPEVKWTPEITHQTVEKPASQMPHALTLYRRSGLWNGMHTVLEVREALPAPSPRLSLSAELDSENRR